MKFFNWTILFLSFFVVIPKFSFADVTGCVISGRLYDIPAGQDNSDPYNIVYFYSYSESYPINYDYNNPAIGHISCTVEDPYGYAGKCKVVYSGGTYSGQNDIFSAKLIPCDPSTNNLPLDQSIIFMLLPLGFFGFWKVRQVVL